MQTIILTDNKRLSTDYNADKTLFAQKIDVNHILNTQVYQSHISRVRFWIVRPNIASQENFVLQVCKNLVNRGNNSINFQFSISKICIGDQLPFIQEKRTNSAQDKFNRNSRMSGYLSPVLHKTIQFPPFMSNFKKQSSHSKTNSSVEWSYQSDINSQTKKTLEPQTSQKQQQITIKPICKKQFQISSLNDLNTIFMNRQSIYNQFLLNEQTLLQAKRMINNYIFKQNQIQIGISVISEGCRKYLEKSINIQISQAFNAQFNSRKQAYQSTCLTQNFSNMPKSSTKLSQQMPKQTYHKILLFLITHFDESQKVKSSTILANRQYNKFVQAVQQWRIKDEDINVTQKLSKQYVLIKQEIQNQKNNFKNKLKIFEAIIGESVNVEKLLNEQKQMETTSAITSNNNTNHNQLTSTNAINDINMRVSRKSENKPSVNNSPTTNMPTSSTNSQFKRLKQSFEMIRNIDNVINEQNKKIQNMKKYLKQVVKQKNQILYKQAQSLNQIKKQIKSIKEQIQQKKLQFQYKSQKLQNQQCQKNRNFVPTRQASQLLEKNVKLFKKIIANQKTNKNNEKYLMQETNGQNKQNCKKTYKISYPESAQHNKKFLIRKQYKSFYNSNQSQKSSQEATLNLNQTQFNRSTIHNTIHQCQKQKQQKLLKKRQQQVQNHNLWMNVNKQIKKSQNWNEPNNLSNEKQKQILLALYNYNLANNQLLSQIEYQIQGYKGLKHQKMNMTLQNQTGKVSDWNSSFNSSFYGQVSNMKMRQKSKNIMDKKGLYSIENGCSQLKKQNQSSSQLNLLVKDGKQINHTKSQLKNSLKSNYYQAKCNPQLKCNYYQVNLSQFPILNNILNPRVSQSAFQSQQCSVISQSIKQILDVKQSEINKLNKGGLQNIKRVTIQNMFAKK